MWIPFNRITRVPEESQYVLEALHSGELAGDGPFCQRAQRWLESYTGCHRAFLTPSCTAALEMAALLAGVAAGDEVVVPSFTFVSTANAFAIFGARMVFADVDPDTLCMETAGALEKFTERTRALCTVHYAGVARDVSALAAGCRDRGVALIEDAAHALGGRLDDKALGTFGMAGTLSFHESKNFACGEGGALLVNDPETARRAEILREKGTNRGALLRGEVMKYTWVDFGSSYLPSDLSAAMLWAQFLRAEELQARRREIWDLYQTSLADWAASHGVRQPVVPPGCGHASHLYYLIMPDNSRREACIRHLQSCGVQSYFHYLPLHLSPMGQRYGGRPGDCPVSEDISARLLRLPLYSRLTELEQQYVIARLLEFTP